MDADFKKVLENKENGLRTGDFELTHNEKIPWVRNKKLGEHSHYEMNKDSEDSKPAPLIFNPTKNFQ